MPSLVQLLKSLPPPGETDSSETRVAARCDDIRKSKIEVPERRKRPSELTRKLLECDLAVVIEPPLSDR